MDSLNVDVHPVDQIISDILRYLTASNHIYKRTALLLKVLAENKKTYEVWQSYLISDRWLLN